MPEGARSVRSAGYSCALILLLGTSAGHAQTTVDPFVRETQRIEDREIQRQTERQDRFRSDQSSPPSGTEIPDVETTESSDSQCVAIKKVNLKGLTLYPEKEFAETLGTLTGDCIRVSQIDDALRAITNRYISDGFVTSRAVVGPQDLGSGTLEIFLVEGALSSIRGTGDGYARTPLFLAFGGLRHENLNLRQIEQGVDQLARLSSFEPSIDIEPGEEPGTSNLLVMSKRIGRAWRPSVSFDNDGSAATGRYQITAGLDLDNAFGVADYWSFYYARDLKNDPAVGNVSVGGFVSVPYGWWTLTLSGGKFRYNSVLSGNDQSFASAGESWNASVSVDNMVYRNANTKFSLNWSLALQDTENSIQGIRLSSSSYRQVTGSVNLRLQRRLADALVGFDLGLARGIDILGANSANTGPGGATIEARRMTAALTYQSKLPAWKTALDYSVILRGQAALDPAFSSGRFSLGGSSTVRGFRDDGISGRYGFFLRQQIGLPLFALLRGHRDLYSSVSGFAGYDAGIIIPHNGDQFERGQLHASVIGLRLSNRFVQAELTASAPVYAPKFIQRRPAEIATSVRLTF